MPKRKTYARKRRVFHKKNYKRRRRGRKGFKRYSHMGRQLSTNGFPKTLMCKHRYYTEIELVKPTVQSISQYRFRANNMYDPDWESNQIPDYKTNHQPMGYDEMSRYYKKVIVIGSKITCYPIDMASNGYVGQYGLALENNPSELTGKTNARLIESGVKFSRFQSFRANTGGNKYKLTKSFSAKKYFNAKSIVGQSEYEQSVTQPDDPDDSSKNAYYILWAANTDQAIDQIQRQGWIVIIEYIALWSDPNILDQS